MRSGGVCVPARLAKTPQFPGVQVRMVLMRRTISVLACAVALVSLAVHAEGLADARGEAGLALMLRKLATVGTVMHATAHPDDENNALMAKQSAGQGLRVVLATATRGNGGQNEIGPELFEALGVLRTEELLAAHRFDGAEQFFTRAVDFGFSFSVEESFEKWGHDEILGDYVRLIRMTRPDVIAHDASRGRGRRPAPPGVGANRHRGVPRGRRSSQVRRAAAGGTPPLAAAEGVSGPLVWDVRARHAAAGGEPRHGGRQHL